MRKREKIKLVKTMQVATNAIDESASYVGPR
jgi:hypothetical protein